MNPLDHLLNATDSYVNQAHSSLNDVNNAFKAALAYNSPLELLEPESLKVCEDCGEIGGHSANCDFPEFQANDEGLAAAHPMNGDQLPAKDESLSNDMMATAIFQKMQMFEILAKQ